MLPFGAVKYEFSTLTLSCSHRPPLSMCGGDGHLQSLCNGAQLQSRCLRAMLPALGTFNSQQQHG